MSCGPLRFNFLSVIFESEPLKLKKKEVVMKTKLQTRVAEIHKRVQEYHKHKNDPYAYRPEEIDAVRELKSHALKDLEFLLALLDQKR